MSGELIVHIGTHKTGTTAIQGALASNRRDLLRDGLLYPRSGRGRYDEGKKRYTGHANLARQAGELPIFEPTQGGADEVIAEARDVDASNVIISAEDFSVPGKIDRKVLWVRSLAERLEAETVRIVVFLRPQWEYMESSYAELVRNGYAQRPFPLHIEKDIEHLRFRYSRLLQPWNEEFGSPTVLGYSGHSSTSVVDDFASRVLRRSLPSPDFPARPNQRAGEKTIEMLRCLRGLLAVARADRNRSDVFVEARRHLGHMMPDQRPFHGLTPRLRERIATRFREDNDQVVLAYETESFQDLLQERPDLPPASWWRLLDADDKERTIFATVVENAFATAAR